MVCVACFFLNPFFWATPVFLLVLVLVVAWM